MVRRNVLGWAVAAFAAFVLFCPAAEAAVSECDYSKGYTDSRTLYVARDGSGDFNCDGTDDEVEINQAFAAVRDSGGDYTSVFLKSGTYVIATSVLMPSGAALLGDRDAVLKLRDQANWKVNVPMVGSLETSPRDITIGCFEVDVNYAGNYSADAYSCMAGGKTCAKGDYACCEAYSPFRTTGKGYYNVAGFSGGSNYIFHDMYLHDGLNDGLNILYGSGVRFYDNRIDKLGHEGLYVKYSDTAEAYGNVIVNRTNSGLRADDTNHVSFHDNDISAFDHWSAGGPGIEIVKDDRSPNIMNDIQIYDNRIHGTYGPGIWITASGNYAPGETAARIHHNIFAGTGLNPTINWTGGIVTSGFYALTIENNVFDKTYNAALLVSNAVNTLPAGSGYAVDFRSNIVTGTAPQRGTTSQGYGIVNLLPATHTVNSQSNVFFQNLAGDYSGTVASSGDLNADPLFADAANGDYHLRSSYGRWDGASWVEDAADSPAIDAGDPLADYSREICPNGYRIDAGRYGNTAEASKSPLMYALTVTGGSGTGYYPAGKAVAIAAQAPAAGQVFDRWTGDVLYVADIYGAQTSVTMPATSLMLTATYKDATYPLTVDGGTGSGAYRPGEQVVVAAGAPAAGKLFDKWTGDTAYVSDIYASTATVTMPEGAVSLTATYKDQAVYALTVNSGSGDGAYSAGSQVTIKADSISGKIFVGWTGDTAYLSSTTAATATVTMPARPITLTANYKTAYYLKVVGGTGSGWYLPGSKFVISAAPAPTGKIFSKWIGDTRYIYNIYSSATNLTMPSRSITLTATYKTRYTR